VSRRARILGASLVLEHVPDLVRYGSKPDRERARFTALHSRLRTYEEAVAHAPNLRSSGHWQESSWDFQSCISSKMRFAPRSTRPSARAGQDSSRWQSTEMP